MKYLIICTAHQYCASNNIKKNVACIREGRDVYMLLVGKPKGKKPLGYPGADVMII